MRVCNHSNILKSSDYLPGCISWCYFPELNSVLNHRRRDSSTKRSRSLHYSANWLHPLQSMHCVLNTIDNYSSSTCRWAKFTTGPSSPTPSKQSPESSENRGYGKVKRQCSQLDFKYDSTSFILSANNIVNKKITSQIFTTPSGSVVVPVEAEVGGEFFAVVGALPVYFNIAKIAFDLAFGFCRVGAKLRILGREKGLLQNQSNSIDSLQDVLQGFGQHPINKIEELLPHKWET